MRLAHAALLTLFLCPLANATPDIPAPLQPWVDWVKARTPEADCPTRQGDAEQRVCQWLSRLDLEVNPQVARFTLQVHADADGWIALPGDTALWPREARIGNSALPVVLRDGTPMAYIPAGEHLLSGQLQWRERPASLAMPRDIGLIRVKSAGTERTATLDDAGRLWLDRDTGNPQPVAENDGLELEVYRRLIDAIPLQLETELRLSVSGKVREVAIGPALPAGFEVLDLQSPLPARLEPDGQLKLQLKPGDWRLRIQARQTARDDQLAPAHSTAPWPAEEMWSFTPDLRLRQLELSGAEQVDTRQLQLPEEWRAFATYRMTGDTRLKLREQRRGDADAGPPELRITRQIWLDFEGGGFTVADDIKAHIPVQSRLNAAPPYQLGRADIDGQPTLITALAPGAAPGIAMPVGAHALHTVSRLQTGHGEPLEVSGWDQPLQSLQATLNLPPGWTLLHASGVDQVDDSWLSRWSLLDIFIVLFVAIGIGRLFGPTVGALALVALTCGYHAQGQPLFLWINLLAGLALCSLLPEGRMQQAITLWTRFGLALLVLLALSFSARQLQQVMYPTLEYDRSVNRASAAGYELPTEARDEAGSAAAPVADEATAIPRSLSSAAPQVKAKRAAKPEPRPKGPEGITQTGPGTPAWQWQQVSLHWNGPVGAGQSLQLTLLTPWQTRLFKLLQVFSLALLLAVLVVRHARGSGFALPRLRPPAAAASAALTLAICLQASLPQPVQAADFPPPALLDELQQRLAPQPACEGQCANFSGGKLDIRDQQLHLQLSVDALQSVALPLPLTADGWQPTAVSMDGQPATLRRENDQWQIRLPAGRHSVELNGPARHIARLHFGEPVPGLDVDAPGWSLEGLSPQQSAQGSLELREQTSQTDDNTSGSRLQPLPAPPFALVERTLSLGLDTWQVDTRVQRLAPGSGAIHLQIPLLEGESVTSEGIEVRNGMASVKLDADQQTLNWSGRLPINKHMTLIAAQTGSLVERWHIAPTDIWEVQANGIPPVREGEFRTWSWYPWPGERVELNFSRPLAVPGPSVTIESARLEVSPGTRLRESNLTLDVRASQGGELPLQLPAGAELLRWSLDSTPQPRTSTDNNLRVPLHPGAQQVILVWRESVPLGLLSRTPTMALPLPATNVEILVKAPQGRWPLLLGGPRIGPAVLLWGVLGVTVLVAIGLGRVRSLPLNTWQWLLLGSGLSLVNTYGGVLMVLWFGLVAWRGQGRLPSGRNSFNAMQCGLFLLTLLALLCLVSAIPVGLLGQPDMKIAGNDSHQMLWRWYQDQTAGPLPEAWAVSLPMLAYRAVILAWALWLSTAALGWGRWAWDNLSRDGLWRSATRDALQPAQSPRDNTP